MKAASASSVEWSNVSGHRSGTIEFKRLLQGKPGARDNYEFSLVRTGGDYATPRHRHNFDQVRLCLEGAMNWAPGRDLTLGTVGYFPEGTFYGPQADTQKSLVLLLQMGGAAGYGFMSYSELSQGYEDLRQYGKFEKGAFTWRDTNAQVHRKDGYEAVWEHVNSRKVEYPQPRYEDPIILHPETFAWTPMTENGDAMVRRLGTFGERDLAIGMIKLARGAEFKFPEMPTVLFFVLQGRVRAGGEAALETWSALEIAPTDGGVEFNASEDSEMFYVQLHSFDASAA